MATELKRFTISIPANMEMDLDRVKKEYYYKDTQNDMIRDLIIRGLASLKEEKAPKHAKETVYLHFTK